MKNCIQCNFLLEDNLKFCSECGTKQPEIKSNSSNDNNAPTIGDKNIMSGVNFGNTEEYKITGTTTINKIEDDTKRIINCAVSGKRILFGESILCPTCTKEVSQDCFNRESVRCFNCDAAAFEIYRREFQKVLLDGIVDSSERLELDRLAVSLIIDDVKRTEIESEEKLKTKNSNENSTLSGFHKIEFERASEQIFENQYFELGLQKLKGIFSKNSTNDEVANLYFMIEALHAPTGYIQQYSNRRIDIYWQHYWVFLAYLKTHQISEAYDSIESNKTLFADKTNDILLAEVAFYLYCYLTEKNNGYLDEAKEQYGTFGKNVKGPLLPLVKVVDLIINHAGDNYFDLIQDTDKVERFILAQIFGLNKYIEKYPSKENNCETQFTSADGDIFEGELKNGLPHGRGKKTFADGDIYEGDWKDGNMHGQGKIKYANGDYYEGSFMSNERSGEGRMFWPNGDVYDGEWESDKMEGTGKMTYSNGDIYIGDWIGDIMFGGKMIYANGDMYEGGWSRGKKNYNGKITFANGDLFEGEWKDDKIHGQGKFTSAVGDIYEGEWNEGNRHGKGKMNYANGEYYEGSFLNNVRSGEGRMFWPNGDIYDGEWACDKMEGIGKMTYANGVVYQGEWKDNKIDGIGKQVEQDGEVYHEGEWIDDELQNYLKKEQPKVTLTDFKSVKIGEQEWATKNLKSFNFRNGDPLFHAKSQEEWTSAFDNKKPAWCFYNFNEIEEESYDIIYNYYAVIDKRNIAPENWHIPSEDEWNHLIKYIGKSNGMDLISKKNGGVNKYNFKGRFNGYINNEDGFEFSVASFQVWTSTNNGKDGCVFEVNETVLHTYASDSYEGRPIRLVKGNDIIYDPFEF